MIKFEEETNDYCGANSQKDAIRNLANEQSGMLTAAQARRLGVSSNRLSTLLADGIIERHCNGIYRLTNASPDRFVNLRAHWMRLEPKSTTAERLMRSDPGGVLAYRTAAAVHRLGHFRFELVDFAVRSRKKSRRPGVYLHESNLVRSDWTIINGLPVTTVLATTRDLALSNMRDDEFTSVIRDALLTYHLDLSTIVVPTN